ncbi:MAG: C40 family peptidase [Alphaproteobacteria bacterium]|nr:C40 family peptidase [Alphaproteobacteria bacterium]
MNNLKIFGIVAAVAFAAVLSFSRPEKALDLPAQDVRLYAVDASVVDLPQTFRDKFIGPWTAAELPEIKNAYELAHEMAAGKFYDGRGRRLSPEFIQSVTENLNVDSGFKPRRAITIRGADIRGIPSNASIYEKRSDIPDFDAAAYQHLRINTPLLIMNVSADGEFYAAYSFQGGPFWVESTAVRFANNDDMQVMNRGRFMTPAQDVRGAYIGTLFPTLGGKPHRATKDGWEIADIKGDILTKWPIPFSETKAAELANAMQGRYAWGGRAAAGRDCSQLVMELFIPFGVFMPRNSRQQAEYFKSVNLAGMNAADKKKTILERAIPFETLLYFPGHVMLYVGDEDGAPLVYHSVWGLRKYKYLIRESFYVIGRTIVSGLDLRRSLRAPTWLEKTDKMLFVGVAAN